MYAVIETGGKQYKVQKGDVIYIEKLNNEVGTNYSFDKVLLVADEGNLSERLIKEEVAPWPDN